MANTMRAGVSLDDIMKLMDKYLIDLLQNVKSLRRSTRRGSLINVKAVHVAMVQSRLFALV
jgi:hypothetical protein